MTFENQQYNSSRSDTSTQVHADWLKIKGAVKKEWANITDDDLLKIDGSKDKLVGTVMSKCNLPKDEAQRQVDKIWATN